MWRRVLRSLPARGPKKGKKTDTKAVVNTSLDTVNIFVDKEDPPVKPIEEYPAWLAGLTSPPPHPLEISRLISRGQFPAQMSHGDTLRLVRWGRKSDILISNALKEYPGHKKLSVYERKDDNFYYPSGEAEEDYPEDFLDPFYRLALGVPWKKERDRMIRRKKDEMTAEDMGTTEEEKAEQAAAAAAATAAAAAAAAPVEEKGKKKKKKSDFDE